VRTIIPSADRQKATVKVRVSFLKLDPRILPDMGIKVTFLSDAAPSRESSARPAILVPENAVREDNGKKVVYVVRNNKAERRAVTLGNSRSGQAEIIAGLEVGDPVVVRGPADLHDGEAVQIKQQ
jgi:HlyD family secretion protein